LKNLGLLDLSSNKLSQSEIEKIRGLFEGQTIDIFFGGQNPDSNDIIVDTEESIEKYKTEKLEKLEKLEKIFKDENYSEEMMKSILEKYNN